MRHCKRPCSRIPLMDAHARSTPPLEEHGYKPQPRDRDADSPVVSATALSRLTALLADC